MVIAYFCVVENALSRLHPVIAQRFFGVSCEGWIAKSFDPKLMTLIKLRVSQMNGCAYCLHMHRHEALKLGEAEDRMLLLDAWHESQLYTPRERAALDWTEALTLLASSRAPEVSNRVAGTHEESCTRRSIAVASEQSRK